DASGDVTQAGKDGICTPWLRSGIWSGSIVAGSIACSFQNPVLPSLAPIELRGVLSGLRGPVISELCAFRCDLAVTHPPLTRENDICVGWAPISRKPSAAANT